MLSFARRGGAAKHAGALDAAAQAAHGGAAGWGEQGVAALGALLAHTSLILVLRTPPPHTEPPAVMALLECLAAARRREEAEQLVAVLVGAGEAEQLGGRSVRQPSGRVELAVTHIEL